MNQFHGLLDNFDSLLLFTVVPVAGDHQHSGDALDDGALSLLESTLLVATGGVGDEHLLAGSLNLQVVGKGEVVGGDTFVGPLSEEFGLDSVFGLVFDLEIDGVVVCTKTARKLDTD